MDNLLFMEKLNERLFEEQRIFKIHSASLVNQKMLNLIFIVEARNYDKYLDDKLMQKVEDKIREIIPQVFNIHIAYKKTFTEEKLIKRTIMDYVYKEYPSIYSFFKNSDIKIDITGDEIKVDIYAEKYIYQFCVNNEVKLALEDCLNRCFMETPYVKIIEVANKTVIDIVQEQATENFGIKLIDISVSEHLLGIVGKKPRYIVDIKNEEAENITVCGVIANIKELSYKKSGAENIFYVFSINDSTSVIDVKFFPRNDKARKCGTLLAEGDKLVIEGPLRYDKFSNAIALFANKIARCEINYDSINTKPIYKKENEYYINVHPKPYINEEQKSLFANVNEQANDLFDGKSFVVFDLETTGITAYDKITEIGAIKIVDGSFTEMFQTLVNPQIPIPADVTQITGITNEMVKDAPIFDDVVADFYKFTRNSTMVGHNISFDMGFITRQAKECYYNFDNGTADTLILSRQNLKLKNHKLKTVCKELGVKLDNAHRAMSDALATANVFKKLIILKEKE